MTTRVVRTTGMRSVFESLSLSRVMTSGSFSATMTVHSVVYSVTTVAPSKVFCAATLLVVYSAFWMVVGLKVETSEA